ncbi:alpha/beta hydrolase [Marinobacter sp. NP-4(2019)]|uniref:alpha/beta hydrolase n=1 Tax=Marinobacter sp. NP-4(2019) TaxID=2488665 RepID=UPI001981CEAB|nr:alpha/beta fold hydrolase [Marinobacter sp. NP-4(2019)]
MIEQNVKFKSDSLTLDGAFFKNDAQDDPRLPIVIVCSGFTGQKNIHPERYARFLTKKGFTVFGFDYRGFGESEGEREHVLIEEQVRDIANAVAVVHKRASEEGRKVVLAGWGMGGGLVLDAYRICQDQVDGLIVMNGFFDAVRVQKALRGNMAGSNSVPLWRKSGHAWRWVESPRALIRSRSTRLIRSAVNMCTPSWSRHRVTV